MTPAGDKRLGGAIDSPRAPQRAGGSARKRGRLSVVSARAARLQAMSAALAALLGRQAAEALDVEVGAYVTSALRDHAAGDLDGDELAECLRGVCAELLEALPDEALAQATQRALVAMQCDMGANEDIEEAGGGQCGGQSGEAGTGSGHLFFSLKKPQFQIFWFRRLSVLGTD